MRKSEFHYNIFSQPVEAVLTSVSAQRQFCFDPYNMLKSN